MGLLSRLGSGIVKAAQPGGPMSKLVEMSYLEEQKAADRTYLEQAETTKHNRLVGREDKAFERLTDVADTKWKRDLELLDKKTKDAIKTAQATGQLEYYKQALASQEAVILKIEEKLEAYLTTGQFEQIDPEIRERKFKAFNAAKDRLKAAQETYNALDAQYRAVSGLPPSLGLETEDFDINAAVNMAAEEIIRSGEEEGATGLISVPTLTDQVKSINDMLERNEMPIMTPEQEASFRELVEAQVRGIGGQQMPGQVSTALGLEPGVSIYEQQKAESAAKEREGSVYDLDLALQKGGRDPTKYIEGAEPPSDDITEVMLEPSDIPLAKEVMSTLSLNVPQSDLPDLMERANAAKLEADDRAARIEEYLKLYLQSNGLDVEEFDIRKYMLTGSDDLHDSSTGKIHSLTSEIEKHLNKYRDAWKENHLLRGKIEVLLRRIQKRTGGIGLDTKSTASVEGIPRGILDTGNRGMVSDDAMIRDLIDNFSKPARV